MSHPADFIVMIDALRHDYISPENTPFLSSLKAGSTTATVVETFAFQTRPAYFAGLHPDESDICNLYEHDPTYSPFGFLSPFGGILRALDGGSLDSFLRRIIRRLAQRRDRRRGYHASAAVMSTAEIPLHLLRYFALSERFFTDDKGVFPRRPTIFDLLAGQGISWSWIGYPRHFGSTESILTALRSAEPRDLYYLHLSELDWIGHSHGPESEEVRTALRTIDGKLRDVLESPLQQGRSVVIFGDHGMVQVTNHIDLEAKILELPLRVGRDFLYFLDSTQARFWFFNENARTLVEALLESTPGGHILSAAERSVLHISFPHNRFGDVTYVIDGGGIIHPSFFARKDPPKGMHGYLPSVRDNLTQVIAHGPRMPARDLGTIAMVDIYEILRQAFLRIEAGSEAPSPLEELLIDNRFASSESEWI